MLFTLLGIERWTLRRDNCASLTGNKYIVSVPGTFSANFTVIDIVYIYMLYIYSVYKCGDGYY